MWSTKPAYTQACTVCTFFSQQLLAFSFPLQQSIHLDKFLQEVAYSAFNEFYPILKLLFFTNDVTVPESSAMFFPLVGTITNLRQGYQVQQAMLENILRMLSNFIQTDAHQGQATNGSLTIAKALVSRLILKSSGDTVS